MTRRSRKLVLVSRVFDKINTPAEIAKIAVILFIPVVIIELGKEAKTLNGILKTLVWGGFNAACVYILTDNLSTGMIVLGITCILFLLCTQRRNRF